MFFQFLPLVLALNQGWYIGLAIYRYLLIYRYYFKYRLSVLVKVRTDKISATGYWLLPNIGSEYRLCFDDFSQYIGKTLIYRQFLEYH